MFRRSGRLLADEEHAPSNFFRPSRLFGVGPLSIRAPFRKPTVTTLPQDKLDTLLARHAMLEAELARPIAPETFVKLSRELAEITPLVERVKAYRAIETEFA